MGLKQIERIKPHSFQMSEKSNARPLWLCRLLRVRRNNSTTSSQMARPGHPVLNWNQLNRAQAVFIFFRASHWKQAMVTETYPTSCTVIYQENDRDHSTRIVDLENIRSVREVDPESNDLRQNSEAES